jgi:tetratricopeptide (TPR) repeat protein
LLLLLFEKSSADTEFDFLARVAEATSHLIVKSRRRKELIGALERKFKTLDWPPSDRMIWALSTLTTSFQNTNTKTGIEFLRRLIMEGREESAIPLLETLMRNSPMGRGFFNLSLLIRDPKLRNRLQNEHFSRLKAIAHGDPQAAAVLGTQLMQIGAFSEAVKQLEMAQRQHGDNTHIATALAEALFWNDQFDKADALAEKLLQNCSTLPSNHNQSLQSVAIRCKIALGDTRSALKMLHEAPVNDLHFEPLRFFTYLCNGLIEPAFRGYWRSSATQALLAEGLPQLPYDTAESAYLSGGKLLAHCAIVCVMGVGDEIRFAQLFPEIEKLFEQVTVLCDHRLVAPFIRSYPNIHFHGVDLSKPVDAIDRRLLSRVDTDIWHFLRTVSYVADLKQFAAIFRRSINDFPLTGCHLKVDKGRTAYWKDRFSAVPRCIGLFWRSSQIAHSAEHKQSTLEEWLALLKELPVTIIPLQYDLSPEENAMMDADGRFLRIDREVDMKNDLDEVLCIMAALPLLLCVPGTAQHMAGAVGTPVICATHPYEARWRKLPGRSCEIWAPSVEIVSGPAKNGLTGSIERSVLRVRAFLSGAEPMPQHQPFRE